MLLKQNRKPQFFADTVRNRNRRFPVVLYGQFSKIKGSHMAHRRPSMFVHGKPNSQAVLTAVFRLDALALSVIATATWLAGWLGGWLGGWLSVTAGIVSKRLNVSENFFDHLITPS